MEKIATGMLVIVAHSVVRILHRDAEFRIPYIAGTDALRAALVPSPVKSELRPSDEQPGKYPRAE